MYFNIIDNVLYFIDPRRKDHQRVVVPDHLQKKILHKNHGGVMAGHFSGSQLYELLSRRWWWENPYKDAINFCKNCPDCVVVSGTGKHARPLLKPIQISRPFQIMGVDIMELPVSRRGNQYVIVFQNFLS